jgi:phosphate transport system substrate-binding protein
MTRPIAVVLLGLLLAPCAQAETGSPTAGAAVPPPSAPHEPDGLIVIPGTGDAQDVLRDLAVACEASHPGISVEIPDSTGSFATVPNTLGGLESVGTRATVLGRTAVKPRDEERRKFGPMYYRELARVPVAFVTHPSVKVTSLTPEQVCGIWSGRITRWKEVGGEDVPISLQVRPEGSNMLAIRSSLPCFRDLVVSASGVFNLRNSILVASIKATENAVGFLPPWEARLHGLDVLALGGVAPGDPAYPVSISLGLVHLDPLTGRHADFVRWLSSEPAHAVMRKHSCAPVDADSLRM